MLFETNLASIELIIFQFQAALPDYSLSIDSNTSVLATQASGQRVLFDSSFLPVPNIAVYVCAGCALPKSKEHHSIISIVDLYNH